TNDAIKLEADNSCDLSQRLIGCALLSQLQLEIKNQRRIVQTSVDIAALIQKLLRQARIRMLNQCFLLDAHLSPSLLNRNQQRRSLTVDSQQDRITRILNRRPEFGHA